MGDLPMMQKWVADPEVVKHTIQNTKTSEEEARWLESTINNPNELLWTIIINEIQKPIGDCILHLKPSDPLFTREEGVSLGIMLGEKDEWGKGYGTEAITLAVQYACDVVKASRVWLTVDTLNLRAQQSYRKVGFCFVRKQHNPDRIHSRQEQYLMEICF